MQPVRVTIVPHTHWDREWYQPFEQFRDRLVVMMDGLIDLLSGGFPHFHLDGQTAMIDDYLAVRPEREEDIKRLAREGRISVGPWVTQMDEFLVSGESLLRNVERGLARAQELGGRPAVGHLPDQFGHVGQMPQILSKAGIDRAVVWRGIPSTILSTSFWWEAPDGSRVLAEYLPFGYSLGSNFQQAKEPEQVAEVLRNAVGLLQPLTGNDRALVMAGGDHHGPDATLPQRLEQASPLTPEIDARVGALSDHLTDEPPSDDTPVWRGELRSAQRAHLLPGVYSNRVHQKRERGRMEALVERYAEPLAALVPGFGWPQAELDRAWQLLLWNGAHDSVCGCSVDQVAREVDARHAEIRTIATGIVDRAMTLLATQVGTAGTVRFNPSPFERGGVPGLGWRVGPDGGGTGTEELPVTLRMVDGWFEAGWLAFRFLDEPDVGDLYTFCPAKDVLPTPAEELTVQGQEATATWPGLSVRCRVRRRESEPFLRLDGVVDNRRPDHRVRLHVRLGGSTDGSVAGAPFELVERGLVSEGGTETPSPTWPARGVAMAGGTAVLSEGVIEYEVAGGTELVVTLLRCVGTISRGQLATRFWGAGPDIATPGAQMIGETTFALGLMPDAQRDDLLPAWERFALPLREAPAGAGGGTFSDSGSFLPIEGALLSSVRRRDGGMVATVWNPTSEAAVATVGGEVVYLGPAAFTEVQPAGR